MLNANYDSTLEGRLWFFIERCAWDRAREAVERNIEDLLWQLIHNRIEDRTEALFLLDLEGK